MNVYIDRGFLNSSESFSLFESIVSFKKKFKIPHVIRKCKERSLNYQIIDGHLVAEHFPHVTKLSREIQKIVSEFAGVPVAPLANSRVAVNINITPPGGEYRWHYDRNAVTAVLYLNEVEGGEIDIFQNYRILIRPFGLLQRLLDKMLLTKICRFLFRARRNLIKPAAGELIIMRGNRCLHSVRQVKGQIDRACIVFAYDTPGKVYNVDSDLDPYLYSNQRLSGEDPNYRVRGR